MRILDRDTLKRNANVDRRVLSESTRVTDELRRLGVTPGRAYRLEPALGGELRKHLEQEEAAATENRALCYTPPQPAD